MPEGEYRLLTTAQAAEILGVDRNDIYNFIREEGLPARRLGKKRIRIAEDELVEWWKSRGLISQA